MFRVFLQLHSQMHIVAVVCVRVVNNVAGEKKFMSI